MDYVWICLCNSAGDVCKENKKAQAGDNTHTAR